MTAVLDSCSPYGLSTNESQLFILPFKGKPGYILDRITLVLATVVPQVKLRSSKFATVYGVDCDLLVDENIVPLGRSLMRDPIHGLQLG